jgi:hypothetical protein
MTSGIEVVIAVEYEGNFCPFNGITYHTKGDLTQFFNFTSDPASIQDYDEGKLSCAMWSETMDGEVKLTFALIGKNRRHLKKLLKTTTTFEHTLRANGRNNSKIRAIYSPLSSWTVEIVNN